MKTLKIILFAVTFLVSFTISIAQNYKSQFTVNASGKVVNAKGAEVGWIEKDGTIKNDKGIVVGKVSESKVLDKMGNKIAEVSSDGTLKDSKGKIIYTVLIPDGTGNCKVIDASGKEVGVVHQNYKIQGSCAFHCLMNKK